MSVAGITEKLAAIVARSRRLSDLLESSVAMIAEALGAEACSLFLLDRATSRLTLLAASGDSSGKPGHAVAARRAAEGLAGVAMTQMLPETLEERSRSLLAVPMALRGEPIGVLVVQASGRRPFAADEIQALFGIAAQLVGVVESARLLEALARGEQLATLGRAPPRTAERTVGEQVLRGLAASPGIVIAKAAFRGVDAAPRSYAPARPGDEAAERKRMRHAFDQARNDIVRIQESAARNLGEEHAFIFAAHLVMLADPSLDARLERALASGVTADEAVHTAFGEMAERLGATSDPYLRERVEDIEDLRARLLAHLAGGAVPVSVHANVVVSRRVAPSLVMEMQAQAARGIVAELGGETSHGALLARSLGLPAVTGVEGLMDRVAAGDDVVVDGTEGIVVLRPTDETRARYEQRMREEARRRTEFATFRDRLATTADGRRVTLLANVAFGADIAMARDNGAEGIGLFRTEFPFIVRDGFPTRDEQVRIYRKAYDAFPDGPITFRILDLAGDKFVSARAVAAARGAFHGYRSIRVLFDHPHVLRDQVQAFALAAGTRPLRILVPMVTSLEELLRVQAMTAHDIDVLVDGVAQRRPMFGAMIEVPGAVEIIPDLAPYVEFFSIGTNDLIQYALVADREDARMASARDAYHPAVLRMVRRAIEASHRVGKPVTICGEMAARPDLALALVALGADALSVAPAVVPELKQAFSASRLAPIESAIDGVLASRDGPALQRALQGLVESSTIGH